jgi:hypothetical protein
MTDVELGDARLHERAGRILERLQDNPQGTLVGAMQGRAELAAAYRFFHNKAVDAEALIAAHAAASGERLPACPRVLCLADTSFISYGHRGAVAGLGPHTCANDNGFFIHPLFAVSSEGLALGTLHWQCWAREPGVKKYKTQARRAVSEKESARWLHSLQAMVQVQRQLEHTRLIYVTDREGDFYELLAAAVDSTLDFVIRAQRDRLLDDGRRIGESPVDAPALGTVRFELAGRPGRTARIVTQTLWAQRLRLSARRGKHRTSGVEVTVVWARENTPPAGEEPVQWILLTNLPVATLAQACQIVDWYRLRWRIEMLFDALKNVCQIEEAQLREARALQNLCALHLIVAWRILYLKTLAHEYPHLPASAGFTATELEVLAHAMPHPPSRLDTLHEAVTALAMLGGYLARKRDKPPGLKTLARGHQRLCLLVAFHQRLTVQRCV